MRLTRKQVTFSPLFIGEGSGTQTFRGGSGGHELSVPSSSGKALEPLGISRSINELYPNKLGIVRKGLGCAKTAEVCEKPSSESMIPTGIIKRHPRSSFETRTQCICFEPQSEAAECLLRSYFESPSKHQASFLSTAASCELR